MRPTTIFQLDNGQYEYVDGYVDFMSGDYSHVRTHRYLEIDEETHRRILSILDNPMILTANLRAIFFNQS